MKRKWLISILLIAFLISLIVNVKMVYDKKKYGVPKEREEVLIATLFELQKEGYKESDIKEIETKQDYSLLKGRGEYPYRYIVYVVTKDDPTNTKVFTWTNKDKVKVKMDK